MTSYQRILKATRIGSRERAELVRLFAREKNISIETAYRRIYKDRARVNPFGDLKRKIRSDKGKPHKHQIDPRTISLVRALLLNNDKRLSAIATELGLSRYIIRRIASGHIS